MNISNSNQALYIGYSSPQKPTLLYFSQEIMPIVWWNKKAKGKPATNTICLFTYLGFKPKYCECQFASLSNLRGTSLPSPTDVPSFPHRQMTVTLFGLPRRDKLSEMFTWGLLAGFRLRFSHRSSKLSGLNGGGWNNVLFSYLRLKTVFIYTYNHI